MESGLLWAGSLLSSVIIVTLYARRSLATERRNHFERKEATDLGIHQPRAQHPMINLSACIGCGSCVAACPEGEVLGLMAGKAGIINGQRCVGHGLCAEACPVEAIRIGLGDSASRGDIPLVNATGETTVPGIYIAGELGGLALIRNAVRQGERVAQAIAAEIGQEKNLTDVADLAVIGAGPAGLSAGLAALSLGLKPIILDQQQWGGMIRRYPRKKLVLTRPIHIPFYRKLNKPQYSKEELMAIWKDALTKRQLEVHHGVRVVDVRQQEGYFSVVSQQQTFPAKRVLLAMGRGGEPRELKVPGESRDRVHYRLQDAEQHKNEDILVVGGGDSAVEAAMALAGVGGNRVTLSYRKPRFFRIRKRNAARLQSARDEGRLEVLTESKVQEIRDREVVLNTPLGTQTCNNDRVFIFVGGVPPFELLKKIGIGFGGQQEEAIG